MLNRNQRSIEHSHIAGRNVRALANFPVKDYRSLRKLGIVFDEKNFHKMQAAYNGSGMDAIQPLVTTASIATPVQFLQEWLQGFVFTITGARNIDEIVGISTVGSWEDEQVVQGILERTGYALPYGDYTNVPRSSWNTNFNTQTVVRFEEGMWVGNLDAARAARMRVDDAGMKREAAALALEIIRNSVGFVGFNNGNNGTYGLLNAPGLPSYVTVSNGTAGTPQWSTKTFLEICKDIRGAIVALRNASQDTINPNKTPLTLAVATVAVDWLSTTSDFGISVMEWLNKAYPNIRVVSAPELNAANASANVFYLFADAVSDMSTDDGRTFIQPVPAKFIQMGVQQMAKSYQEDYSNATAGVMCKRPYAVVRRSGI